MEHDDQLNVVSHFYEQVFAFFDLERHVTIHNHPIQCPWHDEVIVEGNAGRSNQKTMSRDIDSYLIKYRALGEVSGGVRVLPKELWMRNCTLHSGVDV